MTKQIATVPLIESDTKARDEQRLRAQLAQQSVLGTGQTNVERLGTDAGDVVLTGLLRPPLISDKAELLAAELSELSDSAKSQVPLFRRDDSRSPGRFKRRGFYEVSDATVGPAHPAEQSVFEFELTLSQAGKRGDSFRALRVNPRTISNPFETSDSGTPGYVLEIPQTAEKIRWFNEQTGESEPPAQAGLANDVAWPTDTLVYTIKGSPYPVEDTALLYDVPYPDDVAGMRVYDTRGNANRIDSNNIRQWQVVHSADHEFDGEIIIQGAEIRLRIQEPPTPSISAETYDPSSDSWTSEPLGDSDWEPFDADLVEIGQHRVAGQIVFKDTTASETFPIFFKKSPGGRNVFVAAPPDLGQSIPSGLQTLLDPIAMDSETDLQTTRTLVTKSEVRQ